MGSGLIFAGFLFLLNPDLFTFDFLPDLIGYLLISAGLKKLAFLEDRMATARRFIRYLAWVSGAKLLSVPMTITTTVENTRLTICFIFFVVELFLSYVAVSNVFQGTGYLAMRKQATVAMKGMETARFFLTGFVFVKHIANFLHPATAIFFPNIDADPDVVESVRAPFMTARTTLFVIGVACLLVYGIYSARVLKAYLKRVKSDTVFCENLKQDYEEKVSKNESMQKRLAIRGAFSCFFVGFVFLADLYLDDVGFLPLFLFPLFVTVGLKKLETVLTLSGWTKRISLAATLLSAASYLYRTVCLVWAEDAQEFALGFVIDPIGIALGVLAFVSVFAASLVMLLAVERTAKEYTAYRYRPYAVAIAISTICLCVLGFMQYRFPSTYSVLPSVQWGVWAVFLYLHKKSLDEIRDEAEYHLM